MNVIKAVVLWAVCAAGASAQEGTWVNPDLRAKKPPEAQYKALQGAQEAKCAAYATKMSVEHAPRQCKNTEAISQLPCQDALTKLGSNFFLSCMWDNGWRLEPRGQ